jgi:hypothetical protein
MNTGEERPVIQEETSWINTGEERPAGLIQGRRDQLD